MESPTSSSLVNIPRKVSPVFLQYIGE